MCHYFHPTKVYYISLQFSVITSCFPPIQAVLMHVGDNPFRLNVPDFSIKPGELVAVVGRVGAGKTSLLQAILGNMTLVRTEK